MTSTEPGAKPPLPRGRLRLACLLLIIMIGAGLRLSHLDIAHFQRDQAIGAQAAWDIAREGELRTHFNPVTGGYNNFPLALYLWAPPFLFSQHIHGLIVWNILLSLISLVACWLVVERYWTWQAAALATLLYATQPWHVWYAHRIWPNVPMSPFVLFWFIGIALAYHRSRRRYWAVAWGMAVLLFQLHASGAAFLIANGCLWLVAGRGGRSWRALILGVGFALIPALPWLGALFGGEALIQAERLPLIGEGKRSFLYNLQPLSDFATASDWRLWFHGIDLRALGAIMRPLEIVALPLAAAIAASSSLVLSRARRGPNRRLYVILAFWIGLPILVFPLVSIENHSLVYYLPLLPAPFIAIALTADALPKPWSRLVGVAILVLCGAQAYAVLGSAHLIRAAVAVDSETVWSVGGGAPLSQQLKIAAAAREAVESGEADEIILRIRPLLTLEQEHSYHAMPLLARTPMRVVDATKPHLLYPARSSVWLLDRRNTQLPEGMAGAIERERSGPYRLYWLPADAAPEPATSLPSQPTFANGVRLLGYDRLECSGAWRLHWRPGQALRDDTTREHFFAAVLGESDALLARQDLGAYDARNWRRGDHIITTFELGALSAEDLARTIQVGMYRFSVETQSLLENVYALDEAGNPWLYAVDLPYNSRCVSAGAPP